ncbi:hypothetical protein [Promicromonospora sp. NFX87]|uniref:hypothetical protein n=1 Tax=Promicromonospora sp. NFX87 TaxID=3402691 RepID=UPI003AFB14DD
MQTVRRFLVLAPVAVVVTAVAYLIYTMAGPGAPVDLRLVGAALLIGLLVGDLRNRAARNAVSPAA